MVLNRNMNSFLFCCLKLISATQCAPCKQPRVRTKHFFQKANCINFTFHSLQYSRFYSNNGKQHFTTVTFVFKNNAPSNRLKSHKNDAQLRWVYFWVSCRFDRDFNCNKAKCSPKFVRTPNTPRRRFKVFFSKVRKFRTNNY